MTAKTKNLLTAITCVLLVALLVSLSVVYAWFLDGGSNTANFVQYSGDLGLDVSVKRGVDINLDGALDGGIFNATGDEVRAEAVYDEGTAAWLPKSSRKDITDYLYTGIDKTLGHAYDEYIEGASILLKVVVFNPAANESSAAVSLNFSDIGGYFFEAEGKTSSEIDRLIYDHTTRIMFKMQDITARTYEAASSENAESPEYGKLVGSSKAAEVGGDVSAIASVNGYATDSFYLWEISSCEKFVEGVVVKAGQLLELDFKLTCMSTDEIYNGYDAYWQAYVDEHTELSAADISFIETMYRKELSYIVSEDAGVAQQLVFTIDKLFVYGTQVPRAEVS